MKQILKSRITVFVLIMACLGLASCPKSLQYHGMLFFPQTQKYTQPAPFSFVAMGDSRGQLTQLNSEVLARLAEDAQFRDPGAGFMVFTGDMIYGSKNPQVCAKALEEWQEIMTSHFQAPIVPLAGNHEVFAKESEDIYRQFLTKNLPQNGPADELGLTYYFDYNRCRFIIIDTDYHGDSDRVRHLDWLESVLKNARENNLNHILVFSHTPAFPVDGHIADCLPQAAKVLKTGDRTPLEETHRFWNMLKSYNVAAYVCGHEHVYARQEIDGVWQIVTGGAGAPLYGFDTNPSGQEKKYYELLGYHAVAGGTSQAGEHFVGKALYHYAIFDVTPETIKVHTYGFDPADKNRKIDLIDSFEIAATIIMQK